MGKGIFYKIIRFPDFFFFLFITKERTSTQLISSIRFTGFFFSNSIIIRNWGRRTKKMVEGGKCRNSSLFYFSVLIRVLNLWRGNEKYCFFIFLFFLGTKVDRQSGYILGGHSGLESCLSKTRSCSCFKKSVRSSRTS